MGDLQRRDAELEQAEEAEAAADPYGAILGSTATRTGPMGAPISRR